MAGSGLFGEILDGDVFKYYSDGEWKKSSSGKSVSIINPTTRKPQYKVQGTPPTKLPPIMESLELFLLPFFCFGALLYSFMENTFHISAELLHAIWGRKVTQTWIFFSFGVCIIIHRN